MKRILVTLAMIGSLLLAAPQTVEAGQYNCYRSWATGVSSSQPGWAYSWCNNNNGGSSGTYQRVKLGCSNVKYGYVKTWRYGPWKTTTYRSWAYCPSTYPYTIWVDTQLSSN